MRYKSLLASPFLLGLAAFMQVPSSDFEEQAIADETGQLGQPLRLVFSGISPETGEIWISLCSEDELPRRDEGACTGRAQIAAANGTSHVFDGIPAGTWAVTAFHDDDSNGQLDFDTRGLPFEATGNSQNARGAFGPPSFDQMKFDLPPASEAQGEMVLVINMQRIG